jgi:transposase-like protein
MTISFARHQFPPAIIRHAVWLYVRFTLSYRDVEDLLAERGLDVSYETVRRWVLKFGPLFARELRHRRPRPTARWHLDEMAVTIAGRQFWLWRAIDDEGEVLDLLVQRRRNKAAAVKLTRKLLKKQGFAPDMLVTDKLRSYGAAMAELGLSARHRACARTIEQRIRINRHEGANARCSGSNRPDQPSASCLFTRLSTTHSTSNAISPHAPRSASSETKRSGRGEPPPRSEPGTGNCRLCTAKFSWCDSAGGRIGAKSYVLCDERANRSCPIPAVLAPPVSPSWRGFCCHDRLDEQKRAEAKPAVGPYHDSLRACPRK